MGCKAGRPRAGPSGQAGFSVLGVGVDRERVADRSVAAPGRLSMTTDAGALKDADAIIICVPTPLGKSREPDISYIVAAADAVAAILRPGQLVVLESTTYPGTTEEVLLPRFTARGLRV